MSEVIIKLTSDRIKIKGGEYVRDIVRCGECKHYNDGDCDEMPKLVSADDFCSYGQKERASDDGDI